MLSPLYGVDAHIHRQSLAQRVYTAEVKANALLTADEAFVWIHITMDGVLIDEMCPVTL